jgi:hypothetical protein
MSLYAASLVSSGPLRAAWLAANAANANRPFHHKKDVQSADVDTLVTLILTKASPHGAHTHVVIQGIYGCYPAGSCVTVLPWQSAELGDDITSGDRARRKAANAHSTLAICVPAIWPAQLEGSSVRRHWHCGCQGSCWWAWCASTTSRQHTS